jgi:S-(hydroxymethyl)glutathione dehydrogenase / alcohol dehydrogenase
MKALVYHRPKDVRVEDVRDPCIEKPHEAILRVTSTGICGSDLHILNGYIPQMRKMVLGHEFMGIIEEVGPEVKNLQVGDRVVVPFCIQGGGCWFCAHSLPTHCEESNPMNYGPEGGLLRQKGGGLYGYTDLYGGYNGGQAERVKVAFADQNARKVGSMLSDEKLLFLTDIFPTGWTAIDWAKLMPGESVAVFGCGPVGLMALKAAAYKKAGRLIAIDILPYRLEAARRLTGAYTIDATKRDVAAAVRELTGGRGADVCVEAVGLEADRTLFNKLSAIFHMQRGTIKVFKRAVSAVRRGGRISTMGVYATSADNFPWGQIFEKGLMLRQGQAPVHNYIDELIEIVEAGELRLDDVITHVLPLKDAAYGYKIFNERKDNCIKVVLKP